MKTSNRKSPLLNQEAKSRCRFEQQPSTYCSREDAQGNPFLRDLLDQAIDRALYAQDDRSSKKHCYIAEALLERLVYHGA